MATDDLVKKMKLYMKKHKKDIPTQRKFAEFLDTSEPQINRWFCGRNKISRAWEMIIKAKLKIK